MTKLSMFVNMLIIFSIVGSTNVHSVRTVHAVRAVRYIHTVHTVRPGHTVHTVHTVHIVHPVHTVHTVQYGAYRTVFIVFLVFSWMVPGVFLNLVCLSYRVNVQLPCTSTQNAILGELGVLCVLRALLGSC